MNYYSEEELKNFKEQNFFFLEVTESNHVLTVTFNREQQKNALHPQMVNEICYTFSYANQSKDVWVILIQAKGNVFCAGADLKAMMGMVEPHNSTIPQPKSDVLIGELFQQTTTPTVVKVTGDVYAGGFFFLSGSTIVVAQEGIKLGLPEVKRGLYPFQVMSSLMNVMPARKVLDWCVRGYNLPVSDAKFLGLVTEIFSKEEIDIQTEQIINEILGNSPTAIRNGIEAYQQLTTVGADHKYLMGMLQKTLMSKDGQEGVGAFKSKRAPVWIGE